jgi:dihydroflavonol-4-reductase
MAQVLVTGANGFIGSHLIPALLERGHTVRALVRPTSDLTALRGLPITLYLGDVRAPDTLRAPVEGVEIVFHLAAALLVPEQATFDEVNTQGTLNMLHAVEQYAGPGFQRFLLTSSLAGAGPGADQTPLTEDAAPHPVSWYGQSKAAAEAAVHSFADRIPATIVRPAAVYGERERDISQTFGAIAAGLHPTTGFQASYAVMVYVGDLVQGMIAAAESPNAVGQTYFLNHPEVLTTTQVVKTTGAAMDKPRGLTLPTPIWVLGLVAPLAELGYRYTRTRPATTRDKVKELRHRYWVADPGKAQRDFGWEAAHNLLEGMRITTRYFFEEQAKVRDMALETQPWLWIKYVLVGIVLGILIEITSATGHFYTFKPGWLVIPVIVGGFGVTLCTLAMLLRRQNSLVQLLIGTAVTGAAELANALGLTGSVGWTFTPGWPFGIDNPYLRSLVLGLAGGIIVLLVNAIMRAFYRRRLRAG